MKPESINELGILYKEALKLLHPLMPFVTEKLYQELSLQGNQERFIMLQAYPEYSYIDEALEQQFALIIEAIIAIRRLKVAQNLDNKTIKQAFIKGDKAKLLQKSFIQKLAKVQSIAFTEVNIQDANTEVSEHFEFYLPIEESQKESTLANLNRQQIKYQKEFDKLNAMVSNANFVNNAPKQLVANHQKRLKDLEQKLAKLSLMID